MVTGGLGAVLVLGLLFFLAPHPTPVALPEMPSEVPAVDMGRTSPANDHAAPLHPRNKMARMQEGAERRRLIPARDRLVARREAGPFRTWYWDALKRTDNIQDPQERARARREVAREKARRGNAIWAEGHMSAAGDTAMLLTRIRFEAARASGEEPDSAFPFELDLVWNRGEYISGEEAYTEPMQEAAAYCRTHVSAAGRLGELARQCLTLTESY